MNCHGENQQCPVIMMRCVNLLSFRLATYSFEPGIGFFKGSPAGTTTAQRHGDFYLFVVRLCLIKEGARR